MKYAKEDLGKIIRILRFGSEADKGPRRRWLPLQKIGALVNCSHEQVRRLLQMQEEKLKMKAQINSRMTRSQLR